MNQFFLFPTPLDATCELVHDTGGWTLIAHPATHSTGRPGQVFDLPAGTPNANGCQLTITAAKKVPIVLRGILMLNGVDSFLRVDDFHLQDATTTLPRLVKNGQYLSQEP